jgi:hypothetical protein
MAEVSGYNPNIPNTPQKNVNRSGDIAQTGGIKSSQKVQRAPDQAIDQAGKIIQQPLPTIARKMTMRDIAQQLLQMDIRPSAENRSLALKMLMHGMELSKANFTNLETILKGLPRTANTEQAAIILASKGLASRTAVQQLATFLDQNPKLSSQLTELLNGTQSLQSMLSGQTVLSPALSSQLTALLGSLEGFVSMLPKETRDKINKREGFLNKAELLTNMRALKALLTGIDAKVQQESPEVEQTGNGLLAALRGLSGRAKDVAENIIVQSILSRPPEREDSALEEKFAYWQIPNSMGTPAQTIELLIQRDKKNKNRTIDPRKAKFIIKTETPNLGEISIEVDIEDDNCDFRFNTIEDEIRNLINTNIEELKQKLAEAQYKTRSIKIVKRNLDVKKYLIPTLDLNNLTRVQTEV